MKRNAALFLLLVSLTSLLVIFLTNSQRPSIQSLVIETHKHFNTLKNLKYNLQDAKEKKFLADVKYLTQLGFTYNPRLYPNSVWTNTSLPVVVTYVLSSGHEKQTSGLIRSISQHLPNHTTLVYDLGLGGNALQRLQGFCNSTRCIIINFDLSVYPSHVEEEQLHAFRPLIIQDALNRAGAVLFLENDQRVLSHSVTKLFHQTVEGGGILGWAKRQPISSLTHPNMFEYFHTTADNFQFLPMVEMTQLILFNTKSVHDDIMRPWVLCALTQDCILPIGAQSGGCKFDKKPQYRYSGCHGYDASALNIVLGIKFDFESQRYTYTASRVKTEEHFFKTVSWWEASNEYDGIEVNATDSTNAGVTRTIRFEPKQRGTF